MCGIAGLYSFKNVTENDISIIRKMNEIQKHRGPDDEGIWNNEHCVLGHRRLSIIDLSSDGHQPFFSDDNRFVLTYNGEIYNYIELRDELRQKGWVFRTKTDVEVLIKSYQEWGAECLSRFNGMFAFAIYDTVINSIFIARDRVGEKPLYYSYVEDNFFFASEIKTLKAIPNHSLSINNQAVFDFLVFNRTDIWDETFHNEIMRLPKGHYGYVDNQGLRIYRWWNPADYVKEKTEIEDIKSVYQKVEELLVSSVQLRMRSDVPVGSCLSGGLDSSVLVGIVAKYFPDSIYNFKTFTASFPGFDKDESCYVDSFQHYHPIKNYKIFPTADSLLEDYDTFRYFLDEPIPGTSPYAQYKVMELAKKHNVTVLLDGQGGDENFAGYNYFHGYLLTSILKNRRFSNLITEIFRLSRKKQMREAFFIFIYQMLPNNLKRISLYNRNKYLNKDYFFHYLETSIPYKEFFNGIGLNESLVVHLQYKLEHLLQWEDRNSMAFSIEARLPYLDHRLLEYMLSLPEEIKMNSSVNKYLQRESVGKFSIPEIVNRKDKIGFETPEKNWIDTFRKQYESKINFNYDFLSSRIKKIDIWKYLNLLTILEKSQQVKKVNMLVLAGLSDKKLESKLIPLTQIEGIGKIFLIRNVFHKFNEKIEFLTTPKHLIHLVILNDIYRLLKSIMILLKENVDYISGIYLINHGIIAFLLGKLFKKPIIQNIIGSDTLQIEKNFIFKKILQKSDIIIIRGSKTKSQFIKHGIDGNKIFNIPNHFLFGDLNNTEANIVYDLIFIGYICEVKRLDILISIVEIVKAKYHIDLKVCIVGDGSLRKKIEKEVNRKGLEENFDFVGFQTDINKFLFKSKVFIMTSKFEGMPQAMIEALSCGLPVIMPNVSNISDYITNGYNGLLVEPLNVGDYIEAVLAMITDSTYYTKLKFGAENFRAEHEYEFSMENITQIWNTIFERLTFIKEKNAS